MGSVMLASADLGGIAGKDFVHHPFRACTIPAVRPQAPPRCGRRSPVSSRLRIGWSLVSLGKLGSWFLLLVISYAMVALINRPQPYKGDARDSRRLTPFAAKE
jgi:hypothetical protein